MTDAADIAADVMRRVGEAIDSACRGKVDGRIDSADVIYAVRRLMQRHDIRCFVIDCRKPDGYGSLADVEKQADGSIVIVITRRISSGWVDRWHYVTLGPAEIDAVLEAQS